MADYDDYVKGLEKKLATAEGNLHDRQFHKQFEVESHRTMWSESQIDNKYSLYMKNLIVTELFSKN